MSFRVSRGVRTRDGNLIRFTFDGKSFRGVEGDTIASALLAADVQLVARSFKYHRPRGIMTAGAEEPNALVTVTHRGRREPNTRATELELKDGMVVESQNRWPSLRFDLRAVNQLAGSLLSAGFYYKTFMWPGLKGWKFYEHLIRKAAGLGHAGLEGDSAIYDSVTLYCNTLVVGGGFAGLLATRAAVQSGKKVIWAEQSKIFPNLMAQGSVIEGQTCEDWCSIELKKLWNAENLQILENTCIFGIYDQNLVAAVQRPGLETSALERFVEIEAHNITIAMGAIERPMVFAGNDTPGIFLGGAGATYLEHFGVAVGKAVVGFTNNDGIYATCFKLAEAGVKVSQIVDVRKRVGRRLLDHALKLEIDVHAGFVVSKANGGRALKSVDVCVFEHGKPGSKFATVTCDALLVSGGWNPGVDLWSQAGGSLQFDNVRQAFIPKGELAGIKIVGSAAGAFDVAACIGQVQNQLGREAAPTLNSAPHPDSIMPLFEVPGKGKKFVDFQNDVTTSDIRQAVSEGYCSVEHLKRYTTLGMGTDQGKISNVVALAILAESLGKRPEELGTTKFRPPYKPITIGAMGGLETGKDLFPVRRTALHVWHEANGAIFLESGDWLRASAYPQSGESVRKASIREASHVRKYAGIVDVSTLGKILVQGPDALELINKVYVNAFSTLAIDRSRYGVMLREDGMVLDDGTVCRLGENRYLITTTTNNAGAVFRNLDRHLQVDWPDLRAATVSLTDHYVAIALAGPKSRAVLRRLLPSFNLGNEAFPFMSHRSITWRGEVLELFRISFSGELAFELFIPSSLGVPLWEALINAGASEKLAPYGLKALDILRIEKGHLTGAEIDGRRSIEDLGFGAMAKPESHYIGKILGQREAFRRNDRLQLVGLKSMQPTHRLQEGMHLVSLTYRGGMENSQGHVTSACYSPSIKNEIALAVFQSGRSRHGESLIATSPMEDLVVEVEVTDPVFFDRKRERLYV